MALKRTMPQADLAKSHDRIRALEESHALFQDHRLYGFWLRWRQLHERFLKKIALFDSETTVNESYIEREMKKLLKYRQAMISSALQYFHPKSAKEPQDAKLFAIVWAESEKVWIEAIEAEIARLRRVYAARQKVRRVLGAYSGH